MLAAPTGTQRQDYTLCRAELGNQRVGESTLYGTGARDCLPGNHKGYCAHFQLKKKIGITLLSEKFSDLLK